MTSPDTEQTTTTKKQQKKTKGIYLRKKIYWIRYADATGKVQRETTGQKNKEKAEELLRKRKDAVKAIRNGNDPVAAPVGQAQKKPFSHLCDDYDNMVAKTQEGYSTKKYYIRQLKGIFGETRISDLTLRMLDFLKAVLQGVVPEQCPTDLLFIVEKRKLYLPQAVYSSSAINRLTSCFKHMMTKGAEWGYGQNLPQRFAKLAKLKEIGRTDNYNEETCLKLIKSAKCIHHRIYVLIGLNAGCRDNEAMHVRWGDIDFTAGTITFQPGYTKSSDHRVNPLSELLYLELRAWHDSLEKKPEPGDWLFAHRKTGERIGSFRRAFSTMCRSVGIACRYHALRHTFASRLAGKKVHVKIIAELIGDSIETTMRYIHYDVSQKHDAVKEIAIGCEAGLNELLERRTEKPAKQPRTAKPGCGKRKRKR